MFYEKAAIQPGCYIQNHQRRGEWAELVFMARAAQEGLHVSRPYGESMRYDVVVEYGGRFRKVQVKSTVHQPRHKQYFPIRVVCRNSKAYKAYRAYAVDFFAVFLIPVNTWYIVPFSAVRRKRQSLHFTPGLRTARYEKFREAWHLLKGRTRSPGHQLKKR